MKLIASGFTVSMSMVMLGILLFGCSDPVPSNPEIDSIVQPYADINDFHGVVAVASSGQILSLNTYGFSDIDRKISHNVNSRFLVGSVSKQFTAGLILQLEDAGLVSTEDPVSKYVPEFPRANEFTIHQLLTHEAGIADIYALSEYRTLRNDTSATLDDVISALSKQELTSEPGQVFTYSNGGYALLAKIIEVAAQVPFGEAVQRYISRPLGLTETIHFEIELPEDVIGYDPQGENGLRPVSPLSPAVMAGSGSILSSAGDLAVWMNAVQKGDFFSDASRSKMLADHGNNYGYGLSVYQYADSPVWEHDGRMRGWSSDIAYYGALDKSVIILSNVQSSVRDRIRNNAADLLFDRPRREYEMRPTASVELSENILENFVGSYSFGGGFLVHVRSANGVLVLRANEGEESDFFPVDSTTYFSRMLYATARFSTPPDTLVYDTGANAFTGVKE